MFIDFSTDYIEKTIFDIDKFGLEKEGETARITILDSRPLLVKRHFLNTPEDYDGDRFTGNYACLGSGCVMCEHGADGVKPPVGKLQIRYMFRVGVYNKADKLDLQLFDMTKKSFEKLVSQIEFHDIKGKDIPGLDILVKCTKPKPFLTYDITVSPTSRTYNKTEVGKQSWKEINESEFTLDKFEKREVRDATSEEIEKYCMIALGIDGEDDSNNVEFTITEDSNRIMDELFSN